MLLLDYKYNSFCDRLGIRTAGEKFEKAQEKLSMKVVPASRGGSYAPPTCRYTMRITNNFNSDGFPDKRCPVEHGFSDAVL